MVSRGATLVTTARFNICSFSCLIERCFALSSLRAAQSIHGSLIKTGLHRHTFLGNRLLDLYSGLGAAASALRVFHNIPDKNTFSWNILLMVYLRGGQVEAAHQLFDEMPNRDVVSWNSLISGYASGGFVDMAFGILARMQELGVKASAFTLSMTVSCVSSARQAKEVHGSVVRFKLGSSSAVLSNSLIDMYGRVGLVRYANHVFGAMDDPDVISWNSMLSAYGRSGHITKALECFCAMRSAGFSADEFTLSSVLNLCADLQDMAKGEQLLAHCFKMGFLSNSIVSSAVVDMYSICGRLDNAVQIFQEMPRWDSALCNSTLACYVRNGLEDEALRLFVLALRKNVKPTEFTFATILNTKSCCASTELGAQIHCWVCKMGFGADMVAANALVDMYAKLGLIEDALGIFSTMAAKDLVAWNTMIMGLAKNGRCLEALRIFRELQNDGMKPDKTTLVGILLAFRSGGMIHEGRRIFSLMERKYGVMKDLEHYACMVDMMGQAGRLKEAMDIIQTSPHFSKPSLWSLLLEACRIHGDLSLAEIIAEKLTKLEVRSSLPYLILARMYGVRCKWESMACVQKTMEERGVKKTRGYSWICIRNCFYVFESDQMFDWQGGAIYTILFFLEWEMKDEACVHEESIFLENGYEE
ncbi:hypothetical protein Cni_G12305 [Canna indica]|uniref:Pentatricopeptide repeat-containing protein n=1 Tax=Canna indica TaxID=4628 RepID=A0AAQ3QCL6_9LILI|nr:hypothetical protein Cni_G12305 [Canna indica]